MNNDVLVWMIVAVVCLVLIIRILRSYSALPHNLIYNSVSAAAAIKRLRETPEKDVVFAVSKGFWAGDSRFDSIYAAYEDYFEKRRLEIVAILGTPTFDGHWMEDAYPAFAVGERIAVWGEGDDTLYLRLFHEDQEVGIEVSLLTPRSPSSNLDSEADREALRKYARQE